MINFFKKLFSKKSADICVAEAPEQEAPASLASNEIADKKKKKKKKTISPAVDPIAALNEARRADADRMTALAAAAPKPSIQQSASVKLPDGTPTSHMGVSRSHKKILVDYQAARAQSTDCIGAAEIEALNNAKAYFLDHDWDVAIDKLSAIIEATPKWAEPWVLLMDCFFELKDWERCVELAEELVYFHPDNVSAPCYQASALKELNRTQEAIFVCNQAIEMFPSSYFLLTIRGDCYFKEEKFKLANESYSRALKLEKFIDSTQRAVARDVVPWARLKWRAQLGEPASVT